MFLPFFEEFAINTIYISNVVYVNTPNFDSFQITYFITVYYIEKAS